jgi:hypothetical protein
MLIVYNLGLKQESSRNEIARGSDADVMQAPTVNRRQSVQDIRNDPKRNALPRSEFQSTLRNIL